MSLCLVLVPNPKSTSSDPSNLQQKCRRLDRWKRYRYSDLSDATDQSDRLVVNPLVGVNQCMFFILRIFERKMGASLLATKADTFLPPYQEYTSECVYKKDKQGALQEKSTTYFMFATILVEAYRCQRSLNLYLRCQLESISYHSFQGTRGHVQGQHQDATFISTLILPFKFKLNR